MGRNKRANDQRKNEEYLKIFMEFDLDSSGGVSKHEIMKVLKACEIQMDEGEAEDLINQIDADGGGEVEQDEFIEFLKREDMATDYTQEELAKLFNFFLLPGKSTIGFNELKRMFENLGEKVNDSEISSMILYVDKNLDGELNFEQFCQILSEV